MQTAVADSGLIDQVARENVGFAQSPILSFGCPAPGPVGLTVGESRERARKIVPTLGEDPSDKHRVLPAEVVVSANPKLVVIISVDRGRGEIVKQIRRGRQGVEIQELGGVGIKT